MAWAKGFWRNEETSIESVKKFLEKEGEMAMTMDGHKFFESFIMKGIKLISLNPVVLFAPSKYPLVC
ncbi:acyl-coenzyme A thioesterase 13 [Prunus yedoensis var. nudiflora]|uniref:Acyl-coenzyme A thioesterase 13 n=1 Tax=Prunus yedoensis var. nudiflora TaxID=2094558 RepID=A0A314YK57_PRUYE|nr:acyl-coenzyme A thioesterase 13 [Prunus yedoensis var. nudiflora]